MNALGEHSENAARFTLRLQGRNGNHCGKKNSVAGVPAQEEKYLVALCVHAIDAADPQHVSAHHGQRDPLSAKEVDAEENDGAQGLGGWKIKFERCAIYHCQRPALRDSVINVVVMESN